MFYGFELATCTTSFSLQNLANSLQSTTWSHTYTHTHISFCTDDTRQYITAAEKKTWSLRWEVAEIKEKTNSFHFDSVVFKNVANKRTEFHSKWKRQANRFDVKISTVSVLKCLIWVFDSSFTSAFNIHSLYGSYELTVT